MTFFQEYAKLAAEYMGAVGLDLTEVGVLTAESCLSPACVLLHWPSAHTHTHTRAHMQTPLEQDLEPPKDTLIEVQVLEDCGELATARGTLRLDKHSRVHAHRSDVVHLIRQGKLAQCTD